MTTHKLNIYWIGNKKFCYCEQCGMQEPYYNLTDTICGQIDYKDVQNQKETHTFIYLTDQEPTKYDFIRLGVDAPNQND
jgi:hypothetical protein